MRALVISAGQLLIEERESPVPGPLDVVVRVARAGLNAADLLQRRGLYPAPAGWPVDIPGMEVAGVVSAVGDRVHEPLLGRRVCALVGGGGQSSEVVVPSEHLYYLPDTVSWDEAGGFAEIFTTAYDALINQGHVEPGTRVLISGANGGVGTAAVQLAHLFGAHVIAVTRDQRYHDQLKTLGADRTITLEDVSDLEEVDVIVELVGPAHLERAIGRLAPYGRAVVVGIGTGSRLNLDLLTLMSRRLKITGSTLRSRSRDEKARVVEQVSHSVIPRWHTGDIKVPIDRVFSFESAPAAYDYFAEPGKFGKVLLRFNE